MMKFKITYSDHSFIIVDENYELCLFKNIKAKPKRINIIKYLDFYDTFYRNYVVIDEPEPGNKIPLNFSITETDEDLPLNKRMKYSEDIKVGDIVEGPDGPRTVKDLHRGQEEMYEININGTVYTVNGGHILHLIDKDTGEALDIQVSVYMYMDDEFKSHYVMEQIKE